MKFVYCKVLKNGRRLSNIEVEAENFDAALPIIGAQIKTKGIYIVSEAFSPPEHLRKFSYEELKRYAKKNIKKPKIKLSDSALIALEFIRDKICCYNDDDIELTKSFCMEWGLLEKTHKPYYAFYFWGSGSCGEFCNDQDIKNTIVDKIERSYDDGFGFVFFDIKQQKEFSVNIKDIKIEKCY